MGNRYLGIELTGDQIKIVETAFGRRLKIFNFAVIDTRNVEPHRRAEQLAHTLQVRGFEARDALVANGDANVEHRLLTLPPLSGREMRFVMEREARKLAPAGMNDMVWSYDLLKTKEELGIKKNQILLVTAERAMVAAAQQLIADARLKLHQVTTIPEAVLNLLRQAGALKKDAVRVIVHFAGKLVHIMFAQDGLLLLSREIRFDYADMAQEDRSGRLVSELKRSILYFRQHFPHAQMDQVLISGGNDMLGALATRSSEELGIAGSIIHAEENLDMSAFRGNWDELHFHLPSLMAALGAAWRKTPGLSGINLLPGKKHSVSQRFEPLKLARAACAAAVLIVMGSGVHYIRERANVDIERQEFAQRLSAIEPRLEEAVDLRQIAAVTEQKSDFLRRIGPRVNWAEIFRNLSFVVPETAVFERIRVEGVDRIEMRIRGGVVAPTAAAANADFSRFFDDVRALPFFESVTIPVTPSVTVEDASSTVVEGEGAQLQSRVTFEVVCVLS